MTDAPAELPKIDTPALRQPRWWVMLGMVFVLMLPLLTALGKHATTHTMEYVAVLSSQETWLRMHGDGGREPVADAWLIPYLHARPRVTKPPMTVWLNLLAWSDLNPTRATANELIFRARLVSVGLGVLTILATFWIGCVLRDRWLGLLAATVLGSAFMFQLQSRTASYDIHFVAWATLAIACATWAINPAGPRASTRRMIVGWSLAGVLLAVSTLCKGPLACVVTVLPVLVMTGLSRDRWRSSLVGLLAMLAITAALVLPWYLYASSQVPTATRTWTKEYQAARSEFQPPWYYLLLLLLVVPWTLWLIGGLFQPFVRARGEARRTRLIAWGWLVAVLVMFSIPGAKQNRYILPLLPAAALVIAQVWRDHQAQADADEKDRGAKVLLVPHWLGLLLASIALPGFMLLQPWLRGRQWLSEPAFDTVEAPVVLMFGAVLAALALFGWRRHFLWKPQAAALVTAGWMSVCMTFVWMAYPSGASQYVEAGRHMHRVVGNESLGFLVLDEDDGKSFRECEPFRVYLRRIAWPTPVDGLVGKHAPTLVLARDEENRNIMLTLAGYMPGEKVQADRDLYVTLWRRHGIPTEEAADKRQ